MNLWKFFKDPRQPTMPFDKSDEMFFFNSWNGRQYFVGPRATLFVPGCILQLLTLRNRNVDLAQPELDDVRHA